LLLSNGIDLPTVSGRLGHARQSTTSDIYSHQLKKSDKLASKKLSSLFGKKKKQKSGKSTEQTSK
jgi:integrase